jgi:hypothetical protein
MICSFTVRSSHGQIQASTMAHDDVRIERATALERGRNKRMTDPKDSSSQDNAQHGLLLRQVLQVFIFLKLVVTDRDHDSNTSLQGGTVTDG